MLLCEVALGDMLELTKANPCLKLPKGKHSCKGVGKNKPDPAEDYTLSHGLKIPLGKSIVDENLESTELIYNEYIVYDPAQVKVQFLLKVKFLPKK